MKALEILNFCFAVPGALLLATNDPQLSKYGFIFFLVCSCASTVMFSIERRAWLVAQSVVYMVINIFGIYRWLF